MPISIGSNIASLQAQRRLGEATSAVSKISERLSSGQRINNSSDDPAGLAISDSLKADTRVYSQAIRNVNDGISVLTIAEGAISALTDVVTRIKELSEQASNGTYSAAQRAALDNEAQALSKEYSRVSRSSKFNGLNLFDGSIPGTLKLQAGYGSDGNLESTLGGTLGSGTFSFAATNSGTSTFYDSKLKDLNSDGILDFVSADIGGASVRIGNGDGTFGSAVSYAMGIVQTQALALADINNDGKWDVITNGAGYVAIRLGNGDGTLGNVTTSATESIVGANSYALSLADLNGDGNVDLVSGGINGNSIRLGNGDGSFASFVTISTTSTYGSELADINNDGRLDLIAGGGASRTYTYLGNGDGTFGASTSISGSGFFIRTPLVGDFNNDGNLDLAAIGSSASTFTVRIGDGTGSFGASTVYSSLLTTSQTDARLLDANGDGNIDIAISASIGANTGVSILLGTGQGTFGTATTYQTATGNFTSSLDVGDINGDGVVDIVSGSTTLVSFLGRTRQGIAPLAAFSLKTRAAALDALSQFSNNLNRLTLQRSVIGAFQSRLATSLSTLRTTTENYIAAKSRITDADVAQESANLVQKQILQKTAAAVLAQANQAPGVALDILKNI